MVEKPNCIVMNKNTQSKNRIIFDWKVEPILLSKNIPDLNTFYKLTQTTN